VLDTITTVSTYHAFVNERSTARWLFRSPPSKAVKQSSAGVSLGVRDCAAFLQCAQRDGHSPSRILRTFVEAVAEGLPHPKPQPLLKNGGGKVMIWSIVPTDLYTQAMKQANAEGVTVTSILRGFILAYAYEPVEGGAIKTADTAA
jgi:hypothetical protein